DLRSAAQTDNRRRRTVLPALSVTSCLATSSYHLSEQLSYSDCNISDVDGSAVSSCIVGNVRKHTTGTTTKEDTSWRIAINWSYSRPASRSINSNSKWRSNSASRLTP